MKTVTLIAKGPSAEHAAEWIKGDVATINDACKLIPGVAIDWAFFTHQKFSEMLESDSHRIATFVAPNQVEHEGQPAPGWMLDRLIEYPDRECAGSTEDLQSRIMAGGICHHNTVNGALHWLAKFGKYDCIRVIGVDGGRAYAAGTGVLSEKWHQIISANEGTEDYLNIWKAVTHRLAGVLDNIYGTEVIFYGH